jgi:hypothetical protein
VFIVLVLLQCCYLVVERIVLLSRVDTANTQQLHEAVWFFGIIVLSAVFIAYFAIHAMLTVNVSCSLGSVLVTPNRKLNTQAFELLAFFAVSLLMLARLVVEYVNRSDECNSSAAPVCLAFLVVAVTFNVSAMARHVP